jgi:hypothetical protein
MKKFILIIFGFTVISCGNNQTSNSENPIKVLSEREGKGIEEALGENGKPFDNIETAEKYYFDIRDKDTIKINEFISKNKSLNLDYTPNSLLRLEDFYLKCFVENKARTDYSKSDFEYIITQYVRHIYVKNKLAKWAVVENDFAQGKYELGVEFEKFGKQQRNFGLDLDQSSDIKTRNYLLNAYETFAQ